MTVSNQFLGCTDMELLKVIGVGIIGALLALTLKESKNEFSIYVVLSTGVIILIYLITSLSNVIQAFNEIIVDSNINSELFSGILKIIGIGYITEYSAGICSDSGSVSIASKIELAGKLTIFIMAVPIIKTLIKVLTGFVV